METGHPICVQNCLGFSEWLVNSVTVFGFCLSIPMIIIGVGIHTHLCEAEDGA